MESTIVKSKKKEAYRTDCIRNCGRHYSNNGNYSSNLHKQCNKTAA